MHFYFDGATHKLPFERGSWEKWSGQRCSSASWCGAALCAVGGDPMAVGMARQARSAGTTAALHCKHTMQLQLNMIMHDTCPCGVQRTGWLDACMRCCRQVLLEGRQQCADGMASW